jgi:hypothetical protein
MRSIRKTVTSVVLIVAALAAVLVVREAFFGYTAFFVLVPWAKISTDNKPTEGWLHKGRKWQCLFLTRIVSGRRESYWISRPGEKSGGVASCGHWVASRFPVIAIGDVNPPCVTIANDDLLERRPSTFKRMPAFGTKTIEFTADDGGRVKVSW